MSLAASRLKGAKRWLVFLAGPVAIVACMFLALLFVSKILHPAEGSGFLIGGLVAGLSLVGLMIYYPVFLVIVIVVWLKRRKSTPPL